MRNLQNFHSLEFSTVVKTFMFFTGLMYSFSADIKLVTYICVVGLFINFLYRYGDVKRFRKLNMLVWIFAFIVLISGIYGQYRFGKASWNVGFSSSILFFTKLIACIGFIELSIVDRKILDVMRCLIFFLFIYILPIDIFILLNRQRITYDNVDIIVGSKFSISYCHLIFVALLSSLYKIKRYVFLLLIILCIFISFCVYCATGLIGAVLFFFIITFQDLFKKILYSPVVLLAGILVCASFVWVIGYLLDNSYYGLFLDLLNRNSDMSGRITIYSYLNKLVSDSFWLGYGNGNGIPVVMYTTRLGNSQNGVINDILNWGIIGFVSMISIPIYIIHKVHKVSDNNRTFGLLVIMYLYVIMGLVEITLGMGFIVVASLFLMVSYIPSRNDKIGITQIRKYVQSKYNSTSL